MIIRWWRAVAGSQEVLQHYADHLHRTKFKEMVTLLGHLGGYVAVKVNGTDCELVVTSLSSDLASAGPFKKGRSTMPWSSGAPRSYWNPLT